MRLARAFLAAILCALAANAQPGPAPGYLRPDGSIYIVGDRALEPVLARVNTLYASLYPETRFTLLLRDKPVGIDGIVAGVSLFAPVAHEAWDGEMEAFTRLNGYAPLDVRIGRFGHVAAGRDGPPAIYVNAANPLTRLDMADAARIFTTGAMPSDLRRWRQLGLGGDWTQHAIHVYGTRDDGRDLTRLRIDRLGGHPFPAHYEALATAEDVLAAVAHDVYGIGLVGFPHDRAAHPANVHALPLARAGDTRASLGTLEEVREGVYPLSPWLHVYVDVAPGERMDAVAMRYLSILLSKEGQQVIGQSADAGLVPLTPAEAEKERAKLLEPRAARNVRTPDERRIP